MNGRLENQIKLEKYMERMLEGQPRVIQDYYSSINNKTHNTRRVYLDRVIAFCDYLKTNEIYVENTEELKYIKPSTIDKYFEAIKYKDDKQQISDSYRTVLISAIKSFFKFLIKDGYIDSNPAADIEPIRSRKELPITYLTPEEVSIIMNNILEGVGNDRAKSKQLNWKDRDYAIIYLLLHSGLRVTALTEINVENIDFENLTIRVIEKENFTREIFISEETSQVLRRWLRKRNELVEDNANSTDALFISNERTRISTSTINDLIKKYTYNIDKKITAHKMRSTFAVNGYNATNDIYVVSQTLGHIRVETTKRYVQPSEEKKRNLIDKMSEIY